MATNNKIFPNAPQFKQRTLEDFKSRLRGGGARPNLFECVINFPTLLKGIDDQVPQDMRFMIKAANLPASNVNVIDVPFRGRNLKVAGDRTFDVWTITVLNDTDFRIRTSFERWMNLINKHDDNSGLTTPSDYQTDAFVYQLGRTAKDNAGTVNTNTQKMPVLKGYRFYGVFPTNVSSIELSYDQADTIEEFTVDLQVQWWDALDDGGKTQLGTGQEGIDGGGNDFNS
tara:strand:+ start:45 stop:728 length:684 start_codon:yes stop_codon:yes gene_type:complete